jgi:glycine cleavage system H protein
MNVPDGLLYTDSHEWILLEGGVATVGITDYAQSELGDVVYVELRDRGSILRRKDQAGTVESVKTVSEIYMPLSGTITELNPQLVQTPELLNTDPYESGWLFKVQASDLEHEQALLLDGKSYESLIH